jgi:uncharacterized protein (DUF488 family)
MAEEGNGVLTIGHSTLPLAAFLAMLETEGVAELVDVRSAPFSRRVPYFNRDNIRAALKDRGIEYAFLGEALGGRPRASHLYRDGIADYERMAREPAFLAGIDRVIGGAKGRVIALMCAEHDPLDCHRCLLIGRALSERHVPLGHILGNGEVAGQRDIEEKLLALAGSPTDDMFATRAERLAGAYRLRARKVAYRQAAR